MAGKSSKQNYTADGRKVYVPQHMKPPGRFDGVKKTLAKLSPSAMFAKKPKPPMARTVMVNQTLPTGPEWRDKKGKAMRDRIYPTNQNITSKYTVITFLPRNLFEQFRRIANVFFLAIAILQFFPKFATVSPGLVILPLLAVLAITALKDGYEDIKRHQADHKVNHTIVHVLKGGDGYDNNPLSFHSNSSLTETKPGYHNYNAMAHKDKTFVPAIPLPKGKKRKAKKGQEEDLATTTALSEGVVPAGDKDWQAARPSGLSYDEGGPFSDSNGETPKDVVNSPASDPDCFDDIKTLGFQQTIWEDVRVGDYVKIYDNEPIPADIVLCCTSEEEDVCFIETKNLDGETNLKSRHGVPELTHLRTPAALEKARFRIDAEPADVNMYKLNGAVVLTDENRQQSDEAPLVHPITLETTILRGCVLKNTGWIIGVVLFTGTDTKIILNSGGTPSKRSKVERQMNPQVLLNLALLAVVAIVCCIVNYTNEKRWNDQQAYWELFADQSDDNPSFNALITFLNAFITFQNIVPISLYISIEFVRTAQAAFIYWDHAIKYVKNGVTTRTTARSWTLSDDLGQIDYVFSDKTGTLTQNVMVFRQCSVGGKVYTGNEQVPENTIVDGKHSMEKSDVPSQTSSDTPLAKKHDSVLTDGDKPKVALAKEVLAPFHDPELLSDMNDTETEQSRLLHGFFAVLGLCHTALAAEVQPGVIEYKAQSPDEAALVQAAADVGFIFRGRDRNIMKLSTPFSETPDEYELLHVLEFNSARKRMSVILRKLDEDNRLFLLCKGADNVIFERLAPGNDEIKKKTDSDLQYFAGEGLRTLCLAYRVLDEGVYEEWQKQFHEASVALQDREDRIETVSAAIERDLVLLGSTAIEDKLQDGVPETIADLKRAGIKVWVATGDKLETAVAIGYTTNLLTKDSNLIIVREGRTEVYDQLKNAIEGFFGEEVREMDSSGNLQPINDSIGGHELRRLDTGVTSLVGRDNGTRTGGHSLVIDGGALRHAFADPATEELLLHLSTQCNTVICCRVSPLQKAQIVRLIKDNLGVMCLAIGDGANDVSMIQAADIGVGISGEEGLQAVNSSDYAIAQFRYLKRLLFVHGHWSYLRNSNMILNFFYKNVMGVGVLFWFQIYCGWSTTYVFEYTYLLFWNIFWTLLPVIALGLFDRDIDADSLMALPELYKVAKEGHWFGLRRFGYFMLQGAYQSAVVFFFINYAYTTTTARTDGYNPGQYEMSTVMVIGAVMVSNVFTGLYTESWNVWVWVAVLLGPVLIWLYTAIYSIIPPETFATNAYGNDHYLFRSALFWFGWIFVFLLALAPQYIGRFVKRTYRPTDINIINNIKKYHPEIDIATHPQLGGRPEVNTGPQEPPASRPSMSRGISESNSNNNGLRHFGAADRDALPEMTGRPSYSENRRDALGRMQPSSLRGSEVDMSNGLRRIESRGFDFDVEERSIAVQRLNSRLSQFSAMRRTQSPEVDRSNDSPTKARLRAGSIGAGLTSLRNRAGSVLKPKKGFYDQTRAMDGERGPNEAP